MKTTIDIADSLLRRAKQLAAKRNTTLREIVEEALRDAMAKQADKPARASLKIQTFRGKGLQRGLGWDDWQALRDAAYEGRGS